MKYSHLLINEKTLEISKITYTLDSIQIRLLGRGARAWSLLFRDPYMYWIYKQRGWHPILTIPISWKSTWRVGSLCMAV